MGEASVPVSRYREALAKIDALQGYISRLPLRSDVDKLEAEVSNQKLPAKYLPMKDLKCKDA